MMDKNELYNTLKDDGAKLKAINFYTPEQLQEIYDERFGDFKGNLDDATGSSGEAEEHHEEPNTEKLNDCDELHSNEEPTKPEYSFYDAVLKHNFAAPNDEPVEIRTLMFDRGGWCEALGKSYAPGIYRPATVEEFVILKEYAKEIL
jgi:hypothetical protein